MANNNENKLFIKNIDIYQHLKINHNKYLSNCTCLNSEKYYCIPCKISVCNKCHLDLHQKHIIVKIKDYILNSNKIDELFYPFEQYINTTNLIDDPIKVKENIIHNLNDFINSLNEKINTYKLKKTEEIDKIFDKIIENVNLLKSSTISIKKNLNDFIEKNKNFLNLDNTNPLANPDNNNTNFLINYDIINILLNQNNNIKINCKNLLDDLISYEEDLQDEYKRISQNIQNILVIKNNYHSNFNHNSNNNNSKLSQSQKISKKNSKNNINEINNEQLNKSFTNEFSTLLENLYYKSEKLGQKFYEGINNRINKYNKQINILKKNIYNTYKKYGNFKTIEKNIKILQNNFQLKGSDGLFSQRHPSINNLKPTEYSKYIVPQYSYSSPEDVKLDNPLLQKYFSYIFLNLFENNFRVPYKELKSSHADLIVKQNSNFIENEDDENIDFCKAIEDTNEIQIYSKKNNKLLKIPLKLTKNPYGYTKFPIGCRSLLVGDRLYISGGKSENEQYSVVLIYDRRNKKLKRITDLNVSRCFHSMIYNDVFETIMVLGGEKNDSVEIFDPLVNRWLILPNLNVPRANLNFYFDKPRGILYTLFGIEGNIIEGNYSDVIEFLDLKNLKDGWNILDYTNKSQIDLKSLMNVYPINNDLVLFYGGITFRGNSKSICVFNITKSEVNKIQPKILETLRIESKKNKKLSTIISGLLSQSSTTLKSQNNN